MRVAQAARSLGKRPRYLAPKPAHSSPAPVLPAAVVPLALCESNCVQSQCPRRTPPTPFSLRGCRLRALLVRSRCVRRGPRLAADRRAENLVDRNRNPAAAAASLRAVCSNGSVASRRSNRLLVSGRGERI